MIRNTRSTSQTSKSHGYVMQINGDTHIASEVCTAMLSSWDCVSLLVIRLIE